MPRRSWAGVAVIVALASVAVCAHMVGCSSPRQRYKVLSFFFDGVPDPDAPPDDDRTDDDGERVAPARMVPDFSGSVHPERTCTKCHRGSRSNKLRKPRNEICFLCHKLASFGGARLHGPVVSGACLMCHNPHRTENVHLLRKPGSGVCVQCHTSVTMAGLDTHATDRCSDCVRCHDPHASDREHLLRAGVTGP